MVLVDPQAVSWIGDIAPIANGDCVTVFAGRTIIDIEGELIPSIGVTGKLKKTGPGIGCIAAGLGGVGDSAD